ncbi:unannotated protein [freshwater metagenome]|uniref:diacylglycerol O-acyltransferase n=1 Tax=freshwater metagenome TaxID=449393 RepID=A0A6J7IAM9_9ZZZZ|nr:DUF1298 domain-containing protein [Actinomycetota bacterium]
MDRLSALDAAFLDLDTARSPMHVGWVMRFAGEAPPLTELRGHVESRLAAMPRFRRHAIVPPLGIADPWWTDDVGFDIARHVDAVEFPGPVDEDTLRDIAAALLAIPLDGRRPLWRLTLIADTGADGPARGFAIVGQAHHALLDGIAAVELGVLLLDAQGAPPRPEAEPWTPERPIGLPEAIAATALARTAAAARLLRSVADGTLRDAAALLGALAGGGPAGPLAQMETHERTVAHASTGLEALRASTRRHDATINDALLTASTLALAAAFDRRAAAHTHLRAIVPVSVRTDGETGAGHANRITLLPLTLPLGERDPVRLLRAVRARTAAAKRSGLPQAGAALLDAADALPRPLRPALTRRAVKAGAPDVVISNVPGPTEPLELLGRPMLAAWPSVPLVEGQGITIGALSYAGRLFVGVTADPLVVPDAELIARDLEQALVAIATAQEPVAETPTPWRARALERRRARGGA